MVLKDRKTGDVYKLNIVNVVVVECDIIYVSILYHLYRMEYILHLRLPWKVYIILKVQRGGGDDLHAHIRPDDIYTLI